MSDPVSCRPRGRQPLSTCAALPTSSLSPLFFRAALHNGLVRNGLVLDKFFSKRRQNSFRFYSALCLIRQALRRSAPPVPSSATRKKFRFRGVVFKLALKRVFALLLKLTQSVLMRFSCRKRHQRPRRHTGQLVS